MSWLYSLVFAGFLFSSGSDSVPVTTVSESSNPTILQTAGQDETERIEHTYPLNANGRVSVSNINGSITVTAWDRNEVHLVAVKTADSKERLADVNIKIDAKPDYLSVETDYPDWKLKGKSDGDRWRNNGRLTVDYQLSVPRGALLNEIETVNGSVTVSNFVNFTKISAVNGSVRATNLRGTANLSTVNGEVAADFDRLETGSKISLNTVNGRVNLLIPSDANVTIKADSLNGAITNDFGLPVRKGQYVGRDLYGKVGTGDVQIKLESVNGGLSVKRQNDGKSVNPSTNLLQLKGGDEDKDEDNDEDSENSPAVVKIHKNALKINKEAVRAAARAQADVQQQTAISMRQAQKVIVKIQPELARINADAMKESMKAINSPEVQAQIQKGMEQQREALAALRDANFIVGIPRIEAKSESFAVKGVPKVTIDAADCSVRVRGWDKSEVKYSVTQFSDYRDRAPLQITQDHNDSFVNIKVVSDNSKKASFYNDLSGSRIEVFVPKMSNLKIVSKGEIRLEGVSGDLEIVGGDESVNIRDSSGKLTVSNDDGLVRLIGFRGDVDARTANGDVFLEGEFKSVSGRATDGTITLTIPDGSNAIFTSNTDVTAEGFNLDHDGQKTWRLGSGGPKYNFEFVDGNLIVRNSSLLGSF